MSILSDKVGFTPFFIIYMYTIFLQRFGIFVMDIYLNISLFKDVIYTFSHLQSYHFENVHVLLLLLKMYSQFHYYGKRIHPQTKK